MSLDNQSRALERGRDQEYHDPDPEKGDGVVTPGRLREIARVWAAHHGHFSDEQGLLSGAILLLIDDRERLIATLNEIRGILNESKTDLEVRVAIDKILEQEN